MPIMRVMKNNDNSVKKKVVGELDINNKVSEEICELEFAKWNSVKTDLELHGRQPKISQGQIWWTGVGKNVGNEINGKNSRFSRPVLVYRKLCKNKFMAVPLTSQFHEGSWYVPFRHNGRLEVALVGDVKVINIKRLYRMIGEIDGSGYERIRIGFVKLYG